MKRTAARVAAPKRRAPREVKPAAKPAIKAAKPSPAAVEKTMAKVLRADRAPETKADDNPHFGQNGKPGSQTAGLLHSAALSALFSPMYGDGRVAAYLKFQMPVPAQCSGKRFFTPFHHDIYIR